MLHTVCIFINDKFLILEILYIVFYIVWNHYGIIITKPNIGQHIVLRLKFAQSLFANDDISILWRGSSLTEICQWEMLRCAVAQSIIALFKGSGFYSWLGKFSLSRLYAYLAIWKFSWLLLNKFGQISLRKINWKIN